MKTLVLFAALVTTATAQQLTQEDRARVVRYLDQSEKQLRGLVADVNETQWKWHPAPGKWSVGEVAEHIVLAEGLLMESVNKAVASKPDPDWEAKTKGKTEFLEKVMIGRQGKATAPESIVPSGTWTKEETMKRFAEARARTRQFIETTQVPLFEHTLEHPFKVFGWLNAYQWAIYIPLHHIRHNGQLGDVKKAEGYPVS